MRALFKGNRLLDGVLVSFLLHVLILLYAESGAEAWMVQGPHASSGVWAAASKEVACCIDVRLELPPTPIEHPPPPAAPAQQASTATDVGSKNASPSGAPLLPVTKPRQEAVYFYDRHELNVFPVLEAPVHFDIESLPIEAVTLGHADIVIYIEHTGKVVQVETSFSTLSDPTLQLIYRALKKATFTPGRVSGNPVPAKIRWRVVVESASSFTMMNSP